MKNKRIVLHFGFWILAAVFLVWFYTKLTQEYEHTLILVGVVLPVSIATVYFFITFLIPRFLFTSRYGLFLLFSSYTVIIAVWISLLMVILFFTIILTRSGGQIFPFTIDIAFLLAGQFLVIAAGVLGHAVRENYRSLKIKAAMESAQLAMENKLKDSELRFMKTQFHPHFLFNTLNNLYALSLRKSDETPEMILKLSNLLDYSLHTSEKEVVDLQEEVRFIKDYLDLTKMRFQNQIKIDFKLSLESETYRLPPLILMPLVENSVKHGISSTPDQSWIDIELYQVKNHFSFSIRNSKPNNPQAERINYAEGGLGLKNLRSRLDLLLNDKYFLDIQENEDSFVANLKING
jgi:sensor histidine kinase YesM